MTDYRLLIFDWDGTLVDTLPAILQANVEVLREYGVQFDESMYRSAYLPDWRHMYRLLGVPEGDPVRAKQRTVGLDELAVLVGPASKSPAVGLGRTPVTDDRRGPQPRRHLSRGQLGEVDDHRLALWGMLAAAPEDQNPPSRLALPRYFIDGAAFFYRAGERNRFPELRVGRHEMIGLGRALGRAARRTEPQVQLVLNAVAASAEHHAHRRAGASAAHCAEA